MDHYNQSERQRASSRKDAGPKPLRVLMVAPSFDILGGQAVQAARLLDRLRQEPSLEVGFLPVNPRLPGVLRKLQAIKYVRTFVLAPTPALLIGNLYGKKLLLNYHSGEAEDHLHRWRRSAIPTIRLADALIVPSAYLVRVFAQVGLEAKPIYNLIETDRFRFRERRPVRPVFLCNRNFEKHYGVDRVLRAFAIVQKCIPEAELIVAGDGPERFALEQLARELCLKNAQFTGRVGHDRVVELYDSADIFLNGSEIDNQPLSILEAFACGLPVVTTDAGGIPDMVTHERTALVVSRGAHEQLAAGALRLIDDPALAQSMIQQGREECRKYEWETVRDQWLDAYHDLALGSTAGQMGPERKGVLTTTAETDRRP